MQRCSWLSPLVQPLGPDGLTAQIVQLVDSCGSPVCCDLGQTFIGDSGADDVRDGRSRPDEDWKADEDRKRSREAAFFVWGLYFPSVQTVVYEERVVGGS